MAERDPFGRLPDENPLAGLGSLSDGTDSQDVAEPVTARWDAFEEVADEPAAQDHPHPQTRAEAVAAAERAAAQAGLDPAQVAATVRRAVRIVRTVVTIAIVLAIGAAVLSVSVSDDDEPATSREFDPERIPGLPAQPQAPPRQRDPPVGLQPRSLLLRRNLAPAMRRLAGSGLGRLRTLRVAPERVDVQLLTRGGRLRSVQVRPGGELVRLSLSGPGFGGLPALTFSQVDAGAPQRLARSAAERVRRSVNRVDYVAFVNGGPQAAWTVVMRGGGQFVGDARGRITRRIG